MSTTPFSPSEVEGPASSRLDSAWGERVPASELEVRVVCRPPLAPGFELAGVPVDVASDGAAAIEVLRLLAAEPKCGIVLVDSVLHRALPDEVRARFERQARPLVTPFPAPAWDEAAEAEAHVLEILRQAIGYRVRPR